MAAKQVGGRGGVGVGAMVARVAVAAEEVVEGGPSATVEKQPADWARARARLAMASAAVAVAVVADGAKAVVAMAPRIARLSVEASRACDRE